MNDEEFKAAMLRATRTEKKSKTPEYWQGYKRGLRRGYHGDKFGTRDEHKSWLSLLSDSDSTRHNLGQGYHDGLIAAGVRIKAGRPELSQGEPSIVLSVRLPKSIYDAIPETKSEWVRDTITAELKDAYCTQNNGDCLSCSLNNYGRDCHNNPIEIIR